MPARIASTIALLLACASFPSFAIAKDYDVGAGRDFATPADIKWVDIQPSDHVIFHGAITQPIIITAAGRPEAPITVTADANCDIQGPVVLEGARFVIVDGFTVHGSPYAAFTFRHGAQGDTVRNSRGYDSAMGVWIGDGAGAENRITNNILYNNKTDGIAIDKINARPNQETMISGNRIYNNGVHGIELNGNYYIVEHNIVHSNGFAMPGTSGIYTLSKDNEDAGKHNIIRYNVIYDQLDGSAQDGNGIELDQWCDDNVVSFNLAFSNDGAGIVIFDGANNTVSNNTMVGNMRDPGNSHAYKADLVVETDTDHVLNHLAGNRIMNNLAVSMGSLYAVYIDAYASQSMGEIAGNAFWQPVAERSVFFRAGAQGRSPAAWNGMKTGQADVFVDPQFIDPSHPFDEQSGASGLIPSNRSLVQSGKMRPNMSAGVDLAGRQFTQWPIGAFAPAQ